MHVYLYSEMIDTEVVVAITSIPIAYNNILNTTHRNKYEITKILLRWHVYTCIWVLYVPELKNLKVLSIKVFRSLTGSQWKRQVFMINHNKIMVYIFHFSLKSHWLRISKTPCFMILYCWGTLDHDCWQFEPGEMRLSRHNSRGEKRWILLLPPSSLV